MADAHIRAVITAQDQASATLKKFGQNVSTTAQKTKKDLTGSYLALAAAATGAFIFGKKSVDAYAQSELAIERLKTGIQNVKSATDKNVDSLINQAKQLQKTTRFSDDAYISAQGILTTFQLNQRAIEKLTPRLADMSEGLARVTGEMPDLESNAILVAKAIGGEDTTGLVGALRRVGVIMTDTQQEMLKTGTVEERASLVTQILDQNFKGMGETAGTTTAGGIAKLQNNFNDFQENVGLALSKVLNPLLEFFNKTPGAINAVGIALLSLGGIILSAKVVGAVRVLIGSMKTIRALMMSFTGAGGIWALFGIAAVAAAVLIIKKGNEVIKTFQRVDAAIDAAGQSTDAALKRLQAEKDPAKRAAIRKAIVSGSRQTGGPVSRGTPYMVGERRPEIFEPREAGRIISQPKLASGSQTVNINVNVGVYAGTQLEMRKLANKIMEAWQDSKSMVGA